MDVLRTTYDADAINFAHMAALEVAGTEGERTRAIVWAYLWAIDHQDTTTDPGWTIWPSRVELLTALEREGWNLT